MFKKLFSAIDHDEYIQLINNPDEDKVMDLNKRMNKINGYGKKTVLATLDGILYNKELLKFLLTQIVINKNERTYEKKVCFSKVRDKDFEKYLDSNNVLVLDSVKDDCDLLIVPDTNEDSSKIAKAKKKGILIVTIEDAYKYFGYGD